MEYDTFILFLLTTASLGIRAYIHHARLLDGARRSLPHYTVQHDLSIASLLRHYRAAGHNGGPGRTRDSRLRV
jgi:hypothetical protein